MLKRLNDAGVIGLPIDVARMAYDQAAKIYPVVLQEYTFEQWLKFLVNAGLIVQKDNKLQITPYGIGFLQYLIVRQLTEAKPF